MKTTTEKKRSTKARKYRNRVIKIVSLLLVIAVTTWFLSEFFLCNANHNTERIRGFYLEDEDSLDVVFVGSSEVYCDYAAGLAYDECGFTSYPFSTESNTVLNFKAIIEEIERTQSPKLIVIEINGAIYGDQNIQKDVNLRRVSDNLPLNENKIELVERVATSDQIEYYVPFIKYHDSWNNFGSSLTWSIALLEDRLRGYNYLKGAKNRTIFYEPKTPNEKLYKANSRQMQRRMPLFDKAYDGLIEFLDYLDQKGIDKNRILFVRVPHIVTEKNYSRYLRGNSVADIVRSYGYRFESFELEEPEIGLDPYKDFYNIEHMNIYGQQKFTKFFAHYLQDNYGITPTKLTEEQKSVWDQATKYYDAYVKYNEQVFKEGKNLIAGEDYLSMREIKKYLK